MRTTLFLSTLFAVSLVGGAALAEKPQGAAAGREPQVIMELRAHGDMVDKVYRAPAAEMSARGGSYGGQASHAGYAGHARQAPSPSVKSPLEKAASRINCADSDPNCASVSKASDPGRAAGVGTDAGASGYRTRAPAFLDKILGSDRTNFNEAGDDEGMSARAANRIWSHAGHGSGEAAKSSASLSRQPQVDRKSQQYQSSRVSCNEGDDCEASSKDTKKEWAYAAVKAGTWTGPEKPAPSNAALRIAAYHAAESASVHDEKKDQAEAAHMHAGSGGAVVAHEAEH